MNTEPEKEIGGDSTPDEQPLCMNCLAPNDPGTNFCLKCGAPLTSYAATGPFEALFAEGFACRQAAERPRRLIVVLGVWAIFGPLLLVGTLLLMTPRGLATATEIGMGALLVTLSGLIVAKTTWNYVAQRRTSKVLVENPR